MWDLVRHHNAAKLWYLQKRTAYSKQRWCALCQKVSEAYEEDDRNFARQIAELKLADQQNAPKTAWKTMERISVKPLLTRLPKSRPLADLLSTQRKT